MMAKFTLSLAVVVLSMLADTTLSKLASKNWNQQGGGRPGFAQVGFGSGKCSATAGVLPDPKSGCCGRHADVDGGNGSGNGYGPGNGDGNDFGPGNGDGNGFGPGNGDGNGYGPGNGDDDDFGPGNGDDNGYGPGNGDGNGFGPGNGDDDDFGPGNGDDNGYGPGNGDGNGFGPGNGDGNGYGPGNGDDNGYGPGDGDGNGFGPGNGDDDDFGPGNGDGNNFGPGNDFNFGNDNEMGNLGNIFSGDYWRYNENNRFKSAADNNASDVAPEKYIIAGKPAGIAQYPWLVHLNVKVQEMMETKMIGCGGSLISSRHVITAAHCVDFQIRRSEDVSIFLAEYNTRSYPTDCVGRQCVKNLIMHPEKISKHSDYQRGVLYNDIAMMKLRGTAPYTDYIRPICLPTFNINKQHEGVPLTITGWGQTEHGQPSSVKLHTQVQLVAPNTCKRHYPELTEGQMCAAGRSGQDTCMGDSGGPIMVEHEGTFYLVGLVSGKRGDAGCGSPVPTLYTNVFAYKKWIENFMRG